jgi:uncharacterized membrane protein
LIAGILLGLAIATKQSAWFAFPFFLWFAWFHFQRKHFWRFAGVAATIAAIFYLPFVLWNFSDLVNSLIFYVSGASPNNYPISGLGFGGLLIGIHAVQSIYAYYPFWIWQIGLAVPVGIILLLKQKKPLSGYTLFTYSAVLSIVWFFNRYFTYTHLSFLLVMVASSYVWLSQEKYRA